MDISPKISNVVYEDDAGNVIRAEEHAKFEMSSISIDGINNKILLGARSNILSFKIKIKGDSNAVSIGEACKLSGGVNVGKGQGHVLSIGDRTTFQGVSLYLAESQSITIGDDCMFSARIEIRTTDSHSVIDVDTGKRINPPGSVVIGDHVWLGKDVIVSKGVILNSNMIVGAKAFVNRSFDEPFIAIAGVPAKIVKNRVNWSRELISMADS